MMIASKPFPAATKVDTTPTMSFSGPAVTQNLDTKMPAYVDRLLIFGRGFSPDPEKNKVLFRSPYEGTTAPTPGCYSVIEASPDRLEVLFDLTRLDALHGYIGPLLASVVVGGKKSNEAQVADVVPSGPMEWSHIDIKNLKPRKSHSIASKGRMLYILGGTGVEDHRGVDTLFGDLVAIDCETLEWKELNPSGKNPPARCLHSATFIDGKMYVFGGAGHAGEKDELHLQYDDLWVFDPSAGDEGSWTEISKSGDHWPEKRDSHAAFALNGKLYIIGGNVIGTEHSHAHLATNFYCFDPKTKKMSLIAEGKHPTDTLPLCRFPSVSVINKTVWMFGGYPSESDASGERLDHLYKYTEGAKEWKKMPDAFDQKPMGRDSHSACVMHNKIYLTGGWQVKPQGGGEMMAFNDTWEFDPMAMKWVGMKYAPAPSDHVAASGDEVSNYFYLQGGFQKTVAQDTHTGSLHKMVNNSTKILFSIHKLGYPHVARGLEPPVVVDSGITWEEVEWDPPLDPNAVVDYSNPKPLEYELYFKERDTNDDLTFAYKGTQRRHRQEGLKPKTWYTWIWRCNNGVGMSGMSPEGDGPTKEAPPAPAPQTTFIRKSVPVMPMPKKIVQQVVTVPQVVPQVVETVVMAPPGMPLVPTTAVQQPVIMQPVVAPPPQIVTTALPQPVVTASHLEVVSASQLSPGQQVSLHNLKNDHGMNGRAGVLEKYDTEKAAWSVNLFSGEGTVTVKPENLVMEQAMVRSSSQSMLSRSIPAIPPFPAAPQQQLVTSIGAAPTSFMQATGPYRQSTPPPAFRDVAPATPVVSVQTMQMTPQKVPFGSSSGYGASPAPQGFGKPVKIGDQK
jgi:N-acetylneuraminic acid mutarotase